MSFNVWEEMPAPAERPSLTHSGSYPPLQQPQYPQYARSRSSVAELRSRYEAFAMAHDSAQQGRKLLARGLDASQSKSETPSESSSDSESEDEWHDAQASSQALQRKDECYDAQALQRKASESQALDDREMKYILEMAEAEEEEEVRLRSPYS